jgi:putative proteasome-type protease
VTYCVAIKVNRGIVFASDSRTNAGVDYIRTYSKMHKFVWPGEAVFVLLTSGNLATSQAVTNHLRRDLQGESARSSLRKVRHLFDAAEYVGELGRREQEQHGRAGRESGVDVRATFILGGQIGEQQPEIFLIYPEGNYISASPETPYLQIGETKYGKPILDRVLTPDTSLADVARCALVSLDSTMRSNISVGPPLELAVYQKDSLQEPRYMTFKLASPYYKTLQKHWGDGLKRVFERLPRFEWEES